MSDSDATGYKEYTPMKRGYYWVKWEQHVQWEPACRLVETWGDIGSAWGSTQTLYPFQVGPEIKYPDTPIPRYPGTQLCP